MDYSLLTNTELERSVLSALIWDNTMDFNVATDGLIPEAFTDKNLQRLFLAMKTMNTKGLSIHDPMLLTDAFNRTTGNTAADLHDITVIDFLSMVTNDDGRVEVSSNIPYYVNILTDLYRRRHIIRLLHDTMGQLCDMTVDADTVATSIVNDITDLQAGDTTVLHTMPSLISDLHEVIRKNLSGEKTLGIRTGFPRIDVTGGLHPSDLVIIAADSSQGKTAMATSITMNIIDTMAKLNDDADNNLKPSVAFYSMEMTPRQIISRIISHKVNISSARLIYKPLTTVEQNDFNVMAKNLEKLKDAFFIDDRHVITVDSLCQSIRSLYARYHIQVAIIDFIQIINFRQSRSTTREKVVGDAARRFKDLARELNIVILLLSQLNRENAMQNPEPSVARLRDSGEINEASDLTLLIYRPEIYKRDFPSPYENVDTHNTAMITIAKDRFGAYGGVGTFITGFHPEYTYFYPLNKLPLKTTTPQPNMKPWK